jgi:hypothetical protein
MATKKDLLRWYNINIQLTKRITIESRKKLNLFWLGWEKIKLYIKRLTK